MGRSKKKEQTEVVTPDQLRTFIRELEKKSSKARKQKPFPINELREKLKDPNWAEVAYRSPDCLFGHAITQGKEGEQLLQHLLKAAPTDILSSLPVLQNLNSGNTFLMTAITSKNLSAVQLLVDLSVNSPMDALLIKNCERKTALDLAIETKALPVSPQPAGFEVVNTEDFSEGRKKIISSYFKEPEGDHKVSAFIQAIQLKHAELLKVLLKVGLEEGSLDFSTHSMLLHEALKASNPEILREVISCLSATTQDISGVLRAKNIQNQNALEVAIEGCTTATVQQLLTLYIEKNVITPEIKKDDEWIESLLYRFVEHGIPIGEKGISIEEATALCTARQRKGLQCDKYGQGEYRDGNPVLLAVEMNQYDWLKVMFSQPIEPKMLLDTILFTDAATRAHVQKNVLQIAISAADVRTVRLLLAKYKEMNLPLPDKRLLLHEVITRGDAEIAIAILKNVDVSDILDSSSSSDVRGFIFSSSPLLRAADSKNNELAKAFLDKLSTLKDETVLVNNLNSQKNVFGQDLLSIAIASGDVERLKLVLVLYETAQLFPNKNHLEQAVKSGNVELLTLLLTSQTFTSSPNATNTKAAALRCAVQLPQPLAMIDCLLKNGTDPNLCVDDRGKNLLIEPMMQKMQGVDEETAIVKRLLLGMFEKKHKVEFLYQAILKKQTTLINDAFSALIIPRKESPSTSQKQKEDGEASTTATPVRYDLDEADALRILNTAIQSRDVAILDAVKKKLIEGKALPSLVGMQQNHTPLEIALLSGDLTVLKNIFTLYKEQKELALFVRHFSEEKNPVIGISHQQKFFQDVARQCNDLEALKALVSALNEEVTLDAEVKSRFLEKILIEAIWSQNETLVLYLLEQKASSERAQNLVKPVLGYIGFIAESLKNVSDPRYSYIETLLKHCENLSDQGAKFSLSFSSSTRVDFKLCRLLIEHGVIDPNARTMTGDSLLHHAVRTNQVTLAYTLLELGADANAKNRATHRPSELLKGKSSELYKKLMLAECATKKFPWEKKENPFLYLLVNFTPLRAVCWIFTWKSRREREQAKTWLQEECRSLIEGQLKEKKPEVPSVSVSDGFREGANPMPASVPKGAHFDSKQRTDCLSLFSSLFGCFGKKESRMMRFKRDSAGETSTSKESQTPKNSGPEKPSR